MTPSYSSHDRLMPIGWAIGGMLALALAVATGTIGVLLAVGKFDGFQKEPLTATALYDLLKIGFAFAAGIGGVVALVTAYRRQRVAEFAHTLGALSEDRETTKAFNERFATAATQLGDPSPQVRLAGVYAMAGLADDWEGQRQTCVDVLCAYLRMPYEADTSKCDSQTFLALRQVRHTVFRVITGHLQPDNRRSRTIQDWRGLDLDFTGAIIDGADFSGAEFPGGKINFTNAEFSARVSFSNATFSGSEASFAHAKFSGAINFSSAVFSGGKVNFTDAEFSGGGVYFWQAEFSGSNVNFVGARFSDGDIQFVGAKFSSGDIKFVGAKFSGGIVFYLGAEFSGSMVDCRGALFSGSKVDFAEAKFSDGLVSFGNAKFSGGQVKFEKTQFSGGEVLFGTAKFSGSKVDFRNAEFSGGIVDFRGADWSVPPIFPEPDAWPPGVHPPEASPLRAGTDGESQ